MDKKSISLLTQKILNPKRIFNLLPNYMQNFEKFSAILAARALQNVPRPFKFLMMTVPPSENIVPAITAGLLLSDFAYRFLYERLTDCKDSLLKGDILVISHSVSRILDILTELKIANMQITEIWEIERLTKYTFKERSNKTRIFVSNPGWLLNKENIPPLNNLIIEAISPSTLSVLPKLLSIFSNLDCCFIITMPLLKPDRCILSQYDVQTIWLWDPIAKQSFESKNFSYETNIRKIFVISDNKIEDNLQEIHHHLTACLSHFSSFPLLGEAWKIYHELRQLLVPLSDVEEITKPPLRYRLDQLSKEEPSQIELKRHWIKITKALDGVYNYLSSLSEPPKFWILAERLERFFRSEDFNGLRIITHNYNQRNILLTLLSMLFNPNELHTNKLEFLLPRQEAKYVARGETALTLLPGFRPAYWRFLDIYSSEVIETIAYSYEAEIEKRSWKKFYDDLENFQKPKFRENVLRKFGLTIPETLPKTPRPKLIVIKTKSKIPEQIVTVQPEEIHIDHLFNILVIDREYQEGVRLEFKNKYSKSLFKERIEIILEDERKLEFASYQSVFIYYETQDKIIKTQANNLRPGMYIVILVDDIYKNIYEELLEALKSNLPAIKRFYLDFWQAAKEEIRKKCNNYSELYNRLKLQGLSIEYQTFLTYFRGEDFEEATMAPLKEEDMKIIAKYSDLLKDEQRIKEIFYEIQQERIRRRQAGRLLRTLLRAIVSGKGYQEAFRFAQELGQEVSDLFSAVEVVKVKEIRKKGSCL